MFIGYENVCKHSLHLDDDWKKQLEHWLSYKLQKKFLPVLHVLLASLPFSDVNK